MLHYLNYRNSIGYTFFKIFKILQTRIHDLRYLFWECTLRCNLKCLHCGSDCKAEANINDMPIKDFLSVLDEIKQHYDPHKVFIAITGGEPLMREDLDVCGRKIYEKGFPWGVVTNGILLSKDRLALLKKAGLGALTISLDGLSLSHDWLRNKRGAFSKVCDAIKECTTHTDLTFDVRNLSIEMRQFLIKFKSHNLQPFSEHLVY